MNSGATFSPCRRYRYDLWRIWEADGPILNTICLNPSTADENIDDPTVTRMIERARRMGFGGFAMTNVFAWRATDPRELKRTQYPVGEDNDANILSRARTSKLVVCGWGLHAKLYRRGEHVERMLRREGIALHVFKLSDSGVPWHPLYLGYHRQPMPWPQIKIASPVGIAPGELA